MNTVAVIDYGMGNLHSVAKAVEHAGRESGLDTRAAVSSDPQKILRADRVIFPGVGAIRDCMAEINRLDVGRIVAEAMRSRPVLAICVGMQALMDYSDENGGIECLGLVPGAVRYFGDELRGPDGERLKVPHMGWNEVRQRRGHPLWAGIPDASRFYFVHSYFVRTAREDAVAGISVYGGEMVAAFAQENIFATQFHPEKSQRAGLRLLGNFLRWDGASGG